MSDDPYYTVCDDILTREVFETIAPESREPYSYEGLCDAILSYNAHHTEKAFGMGDAYMRAAELAAFLVRAWPCGCLVCIRVLYVHLVISHF